MIRYTSYKDSGVEWIGQIPEHWKKSKFKFETSKSVQYGLNTNSENYVDEGVRFLRTTDLDDFGHISDSGVFLSAEEIPQGYLLEENDFLISRSGTLGRTYVHKLNGLYSYAGYLVRFNFQNSHKSNFIFYYSKSHNFLDWIALNTIQSTIGNVNGEKYSNLEFPLPPLPEQQAIVTCLDEKTNLIDDLIKKKQEKIQLLKENRTTLINHVVTKGLDNEVKMKDSDVEWIGEIPQGWEVKRLKYLGQVRYGLGQPPKLKDGGLPLIRATNVYRGLIDEKNMVFVDPEDVPYERDPVLRTNDIIVVRSGAYTADSAIIPEKFDGAITGYDMVLRCFKNCNPKFISYGLLSDYILKRQLLIQSLRAAQPHLNREELNETIVFFPPFEEQQTIVTYLNEQTQLIDQTIQQEEQKIELLKEYRQSLISEVVTGKICVLDN